MVAAFSVLELNSAFAHSGFRNQEANFLAIFRAVFLIAVSLLDTECKENGCTNQQPPQRVGAVPDPIWVGSKWPLAFPKVPVTPL